MNLPESALSQHIAIVGKTGSGKSYTAKGVVEDLIRAGKHVCVIDPGGDWWGLRAAGTGTGLPVAVLGGRHADIEITPESGRQVGSFVAKEMLPCVVDLSDWYKTDQIKFMFGFAETVYRENEHPLHLVIDEADQFSPQNPMAETKKLLNRMEIIVRLGRKRGFRVMMITQRPAILHKNVLTQCNTLIAMRMTAPQDKKAIREWIADNASKEDETQVMRSLAKLDRGSGWVWAPDSDLLELVTFPENQTYDAGRTPEYGGEPATPVSLADLDLAALQEKFAPTAEHATGDQTPNQQLIDENALLRRVGESVSRECERLNRENGRLQDALRELIASATYVLSTCQENAAVSTVRPIKQPESKPPPGPPTRVINESRRPPATNVMAKPNPLYEAAQRIWPVRLSWAALCAMTGRKARGGHFNTTKKAMLESGLVSEDGGLVTLTSPPAAPIGAVPADLLEQNLPNPANKMFAYIRANPGSTIDQMGTALAMQTRGGHWNTGMSILRNNNLITDRGGQLFISDELNGE